MIAMLIQLIIFCAIAGIAWWAVNATGAPQPIRIVVIAAIAIIGILMLASIGGYGPALTQHF